MQQLKTKVLVLPGPASAAVAAASPKPTWTNRVPQVEEQTDTINTLHVQMEQYKKLVSVKSHGSATNMMQRPREQTVRRAKPAHDFEAKVGPCTALLLPRDWRSGDASRSRVFFRWNGWRSSLRRRARS